MKNKKYKGGAGKKILAVFLVFFSFFCLLAIGGGIARFYFGDNSLTLASLAKRIMNGEPIIQSSGQKAELLGSSNEKGSVELGFADKSDKFGISPVDKSQWPKDAFGGLYQLEKEGELKKGVSFKMTLNDVPPADFALGYYIPETKKWEWLPTAKVGEKVFETVLPHASIVGGGSGGACSSMPKGAENVQMYNEIKAGLSEVQIDQQTGEAAGVNDASWKPVWENAKEMTDKAINDYCKNRNLTTEYDFYAAWEMVQCLGFSSLNDRFEAAWSNKCEEKEKKKEYKIDQSDDYKATINLDLGWFYKQNHSTKATIYYSGSPQGVAAKGKPAWKTYWKVRAYVDSTGKSDQTGHLETKDGYYDLKALNTNFNTTDSYELTFSLDNVKEGESFQIRQVRSGAYTSRMSGPDGTMKIRSESMNYDGVMSMQGTQTIEPGHTFTYNAVLAKDLGDDGAIITFSSEPQLTPEQKKQFEEVMRLQKQTDLPVIRDMWTAPGQLNSNIYQSDGGQKPFRIIPVGADNAQDEENDWKTNEEDLSNAKNKQQQNPNDKDGDGVPDLAPLPTATDKNADGIPDSQQ